MKKIKKAYVRMTDILLMFIFGSFSVKITERAEYALSFLISKGFRFSYVRSEKGELSFRAFLFRKKEILSAFEREGVSFTLGRSYGLPALFLSLSKKYGLIMGIFSILLLTVLSQRFIWQITVRGDEKTNASETLEALEELGLKKGAFIPRLDLDGICTDFLIQNKNVSWIRINAIGNCVEVVLKDKSIASETDNDLPSNIVADCDGLIYRVELSGGQTLVTGGESVLKGQVLISGLVQNEKEGIIEAPVENPTYHFERSIAKVFAITNEKIEVSVPLLSVKKQYTGAQYEKKSLVFFSKSINFSFLGRNLPSSCDIIETYTELELPKSKIIPIALKTTLYKQYTEMQVILTEDEAKEIAERELSEKIASLLGIDGALLSKRIHVSLDEDSYSLICEIECIRDIAVETPLFVTDLK